MRWQYSYVDSKGIRCINEALHRLHFAADHPFDHIDVCAKHLEEYKFFCRIEDLHGYERV
jgi:hypothetical protein